jgi:hypothetical protein
MKAMFLKKLRLAVGMTLVLAAVGAVGLGQFLGGGSGAVQAAPPEKTMSELDALKKENELLKVNLTVLLEKVSAQETELRALRGKKDEGGKMGPGGSKGSSGGPPTGYQGSGSGFPGMGGGNFGPGSGLPPTGGTSTFTPPGGMSGTLPGGTSTFTPSGGFTGSSSGIAPGGFSGKGGGAPSSGGFPGPGLTGGAPPPAADPFDEVETALKALRSAKDKNERKQASDALDKAMKKMREQLK